MKITTYQNRYEPIAHNHRRQFIEQGYSVSLIAYNPESDSYDFDVYTRVRCAHTFDIHGGSQMPWRQCSKCDHHEYLVDI